MKSSKPMDTYTKERRKSVITRLEKQLKDGTKPNKGTAQERKDNPFIPLTDKDVTRIKKDIEILKTRI